MKTALEIVNGVPVLTVDGRRVAPMLAERENSFQDEENGRLMQSHGFHLSTAYTTMPWPREREAYDFGPVDVQMETIVRDDPSALYLPRIGCEPPQWWKEEHPEEMPVWENGKIDQLVSVASERWLREVCVHIDSLVRHLESRWDEHIIGYHPCAQNSMEWYYTSTINYCNDWGLKNYDEPFARGFRRWLGRQYGDIAALNDAWGAGYDTFEQIPAPAPDVRRATTHGLLRNPCAEREVIDFTRYQSVAMTDAIRRVARAFKDACGWRKLVYVFYGYTFELAGLQEGISQFGHLDFDAVMDDPAVDVWCAPSGYFDRRNGGSGPIMAPAESCNARGRVWSNEDDLRTHLSKASSAYYGPGTEACMTDWGRVSTLEETLWAHRRNFMAALTHRSQMWFVACSGWLLDDRIWANLEVLRRQYEELYRNPAPLESDVAVVVDERSLGQIAYGIELGLPLLYDMRAPINRMGTAPELWLQSDYLRGKVQGKKLLIFLNAFSLSRQERETIRSTLRGDGATAIWFYAPGILAPDAASPQEAYSVSHIRELTGIRVVELPGERLPDMTLLPEHRFAAGVPAGTVIAPDDIVRNWRQREERSQFRQMTYPPRKRLAPLFAVDDPEAQVLGRYTEGGEAAIAWKERDGVRHIFVGGLTLPAQVFANIAREAGVHLYCAPGDVIYTDGRFLSITACEAGQKEIRLPGPRAVTDVFCQDIVTRGDSFRVTLRTGETRVYRLGDSD